MNFIEFVNKAGIPLAVIAVYILVCRLRVTLCNLFKQRKHYAFFKEVLLNFKVKYDSPWQIVLPSIVSIAVTTFALIVLSRFLGAQVYLSHYGEPLWFRLIGRTILNPLSEEVLFRGAILGGILLTGVPYLSKGRIRGKMYVSLVVVLQAFYFAYTHGEHNIVSLTTRFLNGIVFSSFYLAYKRNLLPAIAGHIIHNLLISVDYFNASP